MTWDIYIQQQKQNKTTTTKKDKDQEPESQHFFSDSKIVIMRTCQPLIKENLQTHGENLEILQKVVRFYFFRPINI